MATSTYNIQLIQGSSYSLRINAYNSDGSYINLLGFGARGAIKNKYSDSEILLNLNPIIHPSYVSGVVDISLSGSQTAELPITVGVYDIEITGDNGYVNKFIRGYVEILPEVTTFS